MAKPEIESELVQIKRQLEALISKNSKEAELLEKKSTAEETTGNVLTLMKFVIDENRKTTAVLNGISNALAQLTNEMQPVDQEVMEPLEELPISGLDARILQFIQTRERGMACAEEVQEMMHYRGKNAACARLSALQKRGLLQRYQLGHKVYYRYDAGKATNTLIVSPPH